MYIGLISDTHCLFDKPLKDFLQPVDEIWHAGDFGSYEVAEQIAEFKPLKGVYGNCDGQELRLSYPEKSFFECEGKKVLMMHIGGYPGRYDRRALAAIAKFHPDIFVCGHSHILRVMNDHKFNMLVLNPGAAGKFGFHTLRTALRFHIDEGRIHDMEVYQLPKTGHTM